LVVLAVAVSVATIAGCVAEGPLAERVDPDGRRLVLLLDRSTSMRDNDPQDAARSGADLAVALAGARDNVALVTFAETADVRVPLRPAGGTAARQALRQALDGVEREGVSDVAGALVRAREVLEAGDAPPGSSIVFLTDGVPYRQVRGRRLRSDVTVDEAVAAIAARRWRLFVIALGTEASTPFVGRLVASTGGAVVVAREPQDLVGAFEQVAVEALGYLRAERDAASIDVVPGTRRVAFVGRWDGRAALGAVTHDGAPAPEDAVIRGAVAGDHVAVALLDGPAPGAWAAELPGARDRGLLVEAGLVLDLRPGTPDAVPAGGEVPVAADLGGDPALVARARERLTLRARLERDGDASGAWTAFTPEAPARLTAPAVAADTVARLVVEAEVTLGEKGYTLRRTRAITVQAAAGATPPPEVAPASPPATLDLAVRPSTFERVEWAGDPLDPVRLAVRGDPARAVHVRCGAATLDLAAGATGVLVVPCPEDGALTVRAEAEGASPWSSTLRGTVRRYRLAPAAVTLPETPAGVAAAPLPVAPTLAPVGSAACSPVPIVLRGPGGAEVPVEQTVEGLVARPGADAPAGDYAGALVVIVDDPRGLRSREVPVTLKVLPAVRPPDPVVVKGAWGWVSRPVEVAWPSADDVAVTIAPGPLAGDDATIDPDLDIRVVPLDGWSGERLGHEPRRFALQVFLSSDLPAGAYRGAVSVSTSARTLSIPVEVEVQR
jgi:hypothetical protein